MFLLKRPSRDRIRAFIAAQASEEFSYTQQGSTREKPPAGYNVDHNRIQLGVGETVYRRAIAALRAWKQFDLGWTKVVPPHLPIQEGQNVAMCAATFGIWSLNACRIVYVINNDRKFGFAYGTLPNHVERGEERFLIEWNEADDSVWYDILAFSQPKHPLVKAGYPLARALQKRFAKESLQAMQAASR